MKDSRIDDANRPTGSRQSFSNPNLSSGPYDVRLCNEVKAACTAWLRRRGLGQTWFARNKKPQ